MTDTDKNPDPHRFWCRAEENQRRVIDLACAELNMNRSTFVVDAAVAKARQVLADAGIAA